MHISLLNICSKLYRLVLNKRVTDWTLASLAKSKLVSERITVPLTLFFYTASHDTKAVVQTQKPYVAFIDFYKAFDSVCREEIWNILYKNGLNGKNR